VALTRAKYALHMIFKDKTNEMVNDFSQSPSEQHKHYRQSKVKFLYAYCFTKFCAVTLFYKYTNNSNANFCFSQSIRKTELTD
jgi:hypothetical protein